MAQMEDVVLAALKSAGKPVRPGDVAKTTGLEKDAVAKTIAGLKKQGKVVSPKACFYCLPE